MTRKSIARLVGVAEATLRGAEDGGILPPFDPNSLREYMLAIEVWQAARGGGVSTQEYGRVLSAAGGDTVIRVLREWLPGVGPYATDEEVQEKIRCLGETVRALSHKLSVERGRVRERELLDRVDRAVGEFRDEGGTVRFVDDEVHALFAEARGADPSLHESANAASWYRDYWRNHPEKFLLSQRQRSEREAFLREDEARETERLLAEHAARSKGGAFEELDRATAKIMSETPGTTKAAATSEAYRRDPALFDRVTDARRGAHGQ